MGTEGNTMSAADIAAVTKGNNGVFNGDGGAWWLLVLFLFAFSNGRNGFFGGGGGNDGGNVQRGFDQQALIGNQSAILQQLNANQQALQSLIGSLTMSQQNCCCETRQAIADLKYTVATEACADRNAISEALRDVISANTASTQRILDQMCQDKMDAKDDLIANLRMQLNLANLKASQDAQTAAIVADNARQTVAIEQYLNPTPVPAYVVQNPNCCAQPFYGGCCQAV